ncbi:hypothetical protein D3871_11085 [Noviherbaspirillum saxi]|uniref:Uncharacterized protein n=2 Tax=Noviherbaspirillum saxi TaxID=2320863 RepID=A0A3A3FS61_9BURK|nr:hypothetical protein D3871_11085 [Noviherbaspirillum saxi]
MDYKAYAAFLRQKVRDFRGIAAATNGDLEVEDLHNEAWVVAEYHGAKRGIPIDWLDPADQSLILGTLTVKYDWEKRAQRSQTVSIDAAGIDEDGEAFTLCDLLHSDVAIDPLDELAHRQEVTSEAERAKRAAEERILESYSQSVAYNVILWHFENVRRRLAGYLAIDRGTLRLRIDAAAKQLKVQPSLFDQIERIASSFRPAPGKEYCKRIEQHRAGKQWAWEF